MKKLFFTGLVVVMVFLMSACGTSIEKITFNCPTEDIHVGDEVEIDYDVNDGEVDYFKIEFIVDDEEIIGIDKTYEKMIALKVGYTLVTVKDEESKIHDKCGISVLE